MPAPTPDQEKLVKLVNTFRGISQYKSIAIAPMESAQDLLNVMVGTGGYLEKFRLPRTIGPSPFIFNGAPVNFIDSMFMFTQGNGTRQLIFNANASLGYFTDPENGLPLIPSLLVVGPQPRCRYVQTNNLLFVVNGRQALKWTGATPALNLGLPAPAPPQLGISAPITLIQRVGSTLTVRFDSANLPTTSNIEDFPIGFLVQIQGANGGPTFNGYFTTQSEGTFAIGTLWTIDLTSPVAGNSGPFGAGGTITFFSMPCADLSSGTTWSGAFKVTLVARSNGIATITINQGLAIAPNGPELVTFAGIPAPYASFNGTFLVSQGAGGLQFAQLGPDIPTVNPGVGGLATGGYTTIVTPRTYRQSWAISTTGEEGPASNISNFSPDGVNGLVANIRSLITVPAPPVGYGIDSFFLYAPQDGGANWVTIIGPGSATNPSDESWPIANPANPSFVLDGFDTSLLDSAFQANFINFPPPQNAAFIQKFQGRIFLGGMPDAPSDIVYSGFDQIFRGRPECSYPPFNRIRLAIGADKLAGFGVLLNGVIAWDISNRMFMFSGTIQDITTTQPVQIADLLEEEPWQTGLAGADTVQSTPRGVVWVGADMTVQIWNGIFYGEIIGPRDLSVNFYPYMRRITPGYRPLIQSAFINWLDRDWYVLNVAVDGSMTPNRLFFFDLSQEGADNLGIWVSDIACDSIAVKVDSKGTRTLVASIGGVVCALNTASTATSGIHQTPTSTTGVLNAYWDSGYWQDQPHVTKLFRYGRLVCDQTGFNLITTVLDDEASRFGATNPRWTRKLALTPGGRFTTNHKGRRQKFLIQFPQRDVDASVLELYTTAIPVAEF